MLLDGGSEKTVTERSPIQSLVKRALFFQALVMPGRMSHLRRLINMPHCDICDEGFHTKDNLERLTLFTGDDRPSLSNTIMSIDVCKSCLDGNIAEILEKVNHALREEV